MPKRKSPEPTSNTGSFEESLVELQSIVEELEDGSLGLESSLARFERGIGILRSCYQILEMSERKIEVLTDVDATDEESPFELAPAGTASMVREIQTDQIERQHADSNERLISPEPSLF
jgi:exodeoxyribonuclease VII small subunit